MADPIEIRGMLPSGLFGVGFWPIPPGARGAGGSRIAAPPTTPPVSVVDPFNSPPAVANPGQGTAALGGPPDEAI